LQERAYLPGQPIPSDNDIWKQCVIKYLNKVYNNFSKDRGTGSTSVENLTGMHDGVKRVIRGKQLGSKEHLHSKQLKILPVILNAYFFSYSMYVPFYLLIIYFH